MVTIFRHRPVLVEVGEGDDWRLDGNHFTGKNVFDGHQESTVFRRVRDLRLPGETAMIRIRIFENDFRRILRFVWRIFRLTVSKFLNAFLNLDYGILKIVF